jgi:hypothetical protein
MVASNTEATCSIASRSDNRGPVREPPLVGTSGGWRSDDFFPFRLAKPLSGDETLDLPPAHQPSGKKGCATHHNP